MIPMGKNKDRVKIGLLGLSFFSKNLGCSALAYSFLAILNDVCESKKMLCDVFALATSQEDDIDLAIWSNIKFFKYLEYHFSERNTRIQLKHIINKCDLVFDFTEGDSFTDIYGIKRWIATSYPKFVSLRGKIPLILGPQTYGPFNNKVIEKLSAMIIRKSEFVYSRDQMSTEYVYDISCRKVSTVIDVAFYLPYSKCKIAETENRFRIGINVSGLLWNNGYTGNNEFGLTVDYKEYCKRLIENILTWENCEVYLIPHVLSSDGSAEDDEAAIKFLADMFPKAKVKCGFKTPMEVKSFIAGLDVFTGSRMHATIAAFSAGVPVIPFSYSRKFQGLYSTLNYPYIIDGKKISTSDAVSMTLQYIIDHEKLKYDLSKGLKEAIKKIDCFKQNLADILNTQSL